MINITDSNAGEGYVSMLPELSNVMNKTGGGSLSNTPPCRQTGHRKSENLGTGKELEHLY